MPAAYRPGRRVYGSNEPVSVDQIGSVPDGFTVAAVGDLLVSRPVSSLVERLPAFADVLASLRAANVVFGNLESTVFDVRDAAGAPLGWEDEWPVHSEPGLPRDLFELGFGLVGRANNLALDWGVESLRRTDRSLAAAGLEHAGTGETASEARAPRYVETAGARVALVSLTTSPATPLAPALDPWRGDRGRPGVNWLPVRRTVVVPPDVMQSLGRIRDAVPELDTRWIPTPGRRPSACRARPSDLRAG
jgi:Bacterial capsule synthesis protein PGA_cap